MTIVNIDVNRCFKCNKNISLIKFKCKCEKYFCIKHLCSDMHDCKYDYKNSNRKKLSEENPVIKTKQLETI